MYNLDEVNLDKSLFIYQHRSTVKTSTGWRVDSLTLTNRRVDRSINLIHQQVHGLTDRRVDESTADSSIINPSTPVCLPLNLLNYQPVDLSTFDMSTRQHDTLVYI